MTPEWIARVAFLDGHRWHNTPDMRVRASSPWHAARQAVQAAKRRLPPRTRIEEVTCHLTRIKAPRNGQE